MAISEGWKDMPPRLIQLVAPYFRWPSTSVMPSKPMAPAAMSQRSFFTRSKSRRKMPRVRKSARPSSTAKNCLGRDAGAEDAVTERESVERKKAMVSISKPTVPVSRRAA